MSYKKLEQKVRMPLAGMTTYLSPGVQVAMLIRVSLQLRHLLSDVLKPGADVLKQQSEMLNGDKNHDTNATLIANGKMTRRAWKRQLGTRAEICKFAAVRRCYLYEFDPQNCLLQVNDNHEKRVEGKLHPFCLSRLTQNEQEVLFVVQSFC